MNNSQEVSIKKKRKGRLKFVFLFLIGIVITIGGIYLYKENTIKYETYKTIAADLYSSEKLYKAGKPYYKAIYKYKVDDKEYKYNYPKKIETAPQNVIVIKYNKDKPSDVYNKEIDKYSIAISISGIVISLISIIVIIARSSTIPDKNIIAVVEDMVTCIGGNRFYLADISIPQNDSRAEKERYYFIFSKDDLKYKIGNQISFNANKYGEFLPTEVYKDNIIAKSLNDYNEEDLVLINNQQQKNSQNISNN